MFGTPPLIPVRRPVRNSTSHHIDINVALQTKTIREVINTSGKLVMENEKARRNGIVLVPNLSVGSLSAGTWLPRRP